MTYHLERVQPYNKSTKKWSELSPEQQEKQTFPYKLFEVASDNVGIISWTENGKAITVNGDRFENEVCKSISYN